MTAVAYCTCRHAQQVHESTVSALCRGRCISHTLDDHTGRCTAGRCPCDAFSSVSQDRPRRAHQRDALAPLASGAGAPSRSGARGGGRL